MPHKTVLNSLVVLQIAEQIGVAADQCGGLHTFGAVLGFDTPIIDTAMFRSNLILNPGDAARDLLNKWVNANGSDEENALKLLEILNRNNYSKAADVLKEELFPNPPTDPLGDIKHDRPKIERQPTVEALQERLDKLRGSQDADDHQVSPETPDPPEGKPKASLPNDKTENQDISKTEPNKKPADAKHRCTPEVEPPSTTDRIITYVTAAIVAILAITYINYRDFS